MSDIGMTGNLTRIGNFVQATSGKVLTVILIYILVLSCSRIEPADLPAGKTITDNTKHSVVLCATGAGSDLSIAESKTVIGSDGRSVLWSDTDHLALWAVKNSGELELEARDFRIYGVSGARAFFTTDLDSPMGDGPYTYYATSPLPAATNWPVAKFNIPKTQDGSGQGIMISGAQSGAGLRSIDETPEGEAVALRMEQQLHMLKFWLDDPSNILGGEGIQRIKLSFPQQVVGVFGKDLSDGSSAPSLSNGSYNLSIEPTIPLARSEGTDRKYAFATVFPRNWSSADEIIGKIYTETKFATIANISLQGRSMQAGHTTAVRILPQVLLNRCKVYVKLNSNPLGEPIQSITLSAPSGCKWGDNTGNVYIWNNGQNIAENSILEIEYENEEAFRTLSGKSINVTFDSEHVQTTQTVNIPSLAGKLSATLTLDVPPLLFEDFSSVGSFSSDDEYATFNTGAKDPYSFLNGWTGARIGASAGKCIRIACRRETSANYDARVDSAPLTGTLKKSARLKVYFDYGGNNEYSVAKLFGYVISTGDYGQTCNVGYITSTEGFMSNSTEGTYAGGDNSFYMLDKTGSWDSTPYDRECILNDVPAYTTIRISWRTEPEKNGGAHNTTNWLYLDNIKVTIEP
ncbi:MAG: hypothetical protein J5764_01980 [Bacteroidales bacterium]|nr:hypothetical protein [Bacteroidales bacterium]